MSGLKQVRRGMHVVDSDGADIGIVDEVRMGDPGAVTTDGQHEPGQDGLLSARATGMGGGSELPRQERERQLRVGYLTVDNRGVFVGSSYLAADTIDRVTGNAVHLCVRGENLLN